MMLGCRNGKWQTMKCCMMHTFGLLKLGDIPDDRCRKCRERTGCPLLKEAVIRKRYAEAVERAKRRGSFVIDDLPVVGSSPTPDELENDGGVN